MKSGADALKKSADALNNDELWEKKKIKKKDEKTGEEIEVEDYDWEAITKAVKSFVEDYNDVVEQAGNSNSKDVLRNAVWMTGITESNENMLSKIGTGTDVKSVTQNLLAAVSGTSAPTGASFDIKA